MECEFRNKKLQELYIKGKSKKYRLPNHIVVEFVKAVDHCRAVSTINDFRKTSSKKFKKLQGYKNRFSIRLSRKYRLEMEIEWEDEKQTTGKVFIVELSKHYND